MTKENGTVGGGECKQNNQANNLCKNACGFYGFANFQGFCSKCHAEYNSQKQNQSTVIGTASPVSVVKPVTSGTVIDANKIPIVSKSNVQQQKNNAIQSTLPTSSNNNNNNNIVSNLVDSNQIATLLQNNLLKEYGKSIPMELESENDDGDESDDEDDYDNEAEEDNDGREENNDTSDETETDFERQLEDIEELALEEILAAAAREEIDLMNDLGGRESDMEIDQQLPIEELIRSITNDLAKSKHAKMMFHDTSTTPTTLSNKPHQTNANGPEQCILKTTTGKTNITTTMTTPPNTTKMLIKHKEIKQQQPSLSANLTKSGKKVKLRCSICSKSIAVIGFTCRCGGQFCVVHRHTRDHFCNFDYRTQGAIDISKANPNVVADKIRKI